MNTETGTHYVTEKEHIRTRRRKPDSRTQARVRVQKWDILKALLIFCVVLGHMVNSYVETEEEMRKVFLFIYTFHMPLFLFVSGLFAKRTVNEKNKYRVAGYLALFVVMKVMFFAYNAFFFNVYEFDLATEQTLPWFMFVLAAFSVITMVIQDLAPSYVLAISILLACVSGYDPLIGDRYMLSRIIVFYPFFYVGYILDHKSLEAFCRRWWAKALALFIIVLLIFVIVVYGEDLYFLRPLLTGKNPYSELGFYGINGFALRLLYYFFCGLICAALIVLTPDKLGFGLLAGIGSRTLGIFVFHLFVQYQFFRRWKITMLLEPFWRDHHLRFVIIYSILAVLFLSLPVFTDMASAVMKVPKRYPGKKSGGKRSAKREKESRSLPEEK